CSSDLPRPHAVRRSGRLRSTAAVFAARSDSRVFVPVVLALVAGAWVALAVWGASPAGYLLDHTTLGHTTFGFDARSLATMAGFVAGWTLMTVAMMLPTIIPLLDILRHTAGAEARASVTVAAVAGYLIVWASFGV